MGGPAMIEGGGLGVYEPGEVGPIDVQHANGVVDLRVGRRTRGGRRRPALPRPTSAARRARARVPDQRALRDAVPEQRKRIYDVRAVIAHAVRRGLGARAARAASAPGMLTALARLEGRPLGVLANDPTHLGGAIDADGADKAARFMQLCDAFDLPVLFLCDTPGFMVGPAAERTAHRAPLRAHVPRRRQPVACRPARSCCARATASAPRRWPAGGFKAPLFTVGWPTSEFGAMGLEGAVRLGMRRELEAIADAQARERAFEEMVAAAYERGRGVNMAAYGEIDDVIDPADSRRWIAHAARRARRTVVARAPARSAPTSTPGRAADRAAPPPTLCHRRERRYVPSGCHRARPGMDPNVDASRKSSSRAGIPKGTGPKR